MPKRSKKDDSGKALRLAFARAKEHPESFEAIDSLGHLLDDVAHGGGKAVKKRRFGKLVHHAIKLYFRYLQRHPGHAAALNNVGVLLSNRGEHPLARKYFAAALAHAPATLAIHRNLRIADILVRKPIGDWHEIPKLGREDPSFLEAYFDPHAM